MGALGAGLIAGGATSLAVRGAVTTGVISPVAASALDGLAFGTVTGALNPVEEGQTRAGNILTSVAIVVPLATAGGIVSTRIAQILKKKGIKPELETPEIAPADLPPVSQVRRGAPFHADQGSLPGLGGRFTAGAIRAGERRAVSPSMERLARGAEEVAGRGTVEAAIRGFEERAATAAQAPTSTPAGAVPTVLGGTHAQLIARERATAKAAAKEMRKLQKEIAKAEAAGLTPESASILSRISVGRKGARRPFDWNSFYTNYLDDLHPINVATRELLSEINKAQAAKPPGFRLAGIEDPYVLARLTRGSVGKANAFLETGPLDFQTLQPTGPGFRQIMQPVIAANRTDLFRSYLASRRTIELDVRGITTPFDPRRAAQVVEQVNSANPTLVRAAQQLDAYQGALLKYLEDSGMLSGKQVKVMREANQSYVPFYRFVEEAGDPFPHFSAPTSVAKSSPISVLGFVGSRVVKSLT